MLENFGKIIHQGIRDRTLIMLARIFEQVITPAGPRLQFPYSNQLLIKSRFIKL